MKLNPLFETLAYMDETQRPIITKAQSRAYHIIGETSTDIIYESFSWGTTPEGTAYWYNNSSNLEKLFKRVKEEVRVELIRDHNGTIR